ncbi:hypothetical protein JM93_03937 [Roseibium hamelinense]|uniref:Uncharacterized protein n=1 Tax=Roseibium hamelinense TaxID=150831 RepID=A0A562SI49_9HYPH|nr:hypothetical protein [Roseibium hamelinense]MTI42479.1 hypothetical protein [Roseibium hamelinense]TWI80723.1 hypothetical protein JM93_03937 [Roseibium hamelinense]
MQISIETTTQSASVFQMSTTGGANKSPLLQEEDRQENKPATVNLLEAASEKAENDAVVIAALQEAVEAGKKEQKDDEDADGKLATVEDYQNTAGRIKSALGFEDEQGASGPVSISYESGSTTTTTIEAEIDGQTVSAEFVSFERVSYNNDTGLSVRTASASSIEAEFGGLTATYQSASTSSLYAGTGAQISQLGNLFA